MYVDLYDWLKTETNNYVEWMIVRLSPAVTTSSTNVLDHESQCVSGGLARSAFAEA